MQPRDKISKSSWTMLEGIKDAISSNVTNAIRSGQLRIEAVQVEKLLAVINSSADEGYHRSHKMFMKTIEVCLADVASDAEAFAASTIQDTSDAKKK